MVGPLTFLMSPCFSAGALLVATLAFARTFLTAPMKIGSTIRPWQTTLFWLANVGNLALVCCAFWFAGLLAGLSYLSVWLLVQILAERHYLKLLTRKIDAARRAHTS